MRVLIVDYNIVYEILSGKSVLDFAKSLNGSISVDFLFNRETELSKALKDLGFNVYIYRHGNSSSRLARVLGFLIVLIKTVLLVLRKDYAVLHANNVMAGRQVLIAGWILRKKRILHIRNPSIPKRQRWMLHMASAFYCVSEYVKKSIIPSKLWNRCSIVYDGFENDIKPTSIGGIIDKPFTIGMLSRISFQKGVHLFVSLSTKLNQDDIKFVHMGGSGSKLLEGSYEESVTERGDNVEWIPYTSNTDQFFNKIDLFVLTAVEGEAFGRVLIEAMVRGIPCVSTKCGGPEEFIEHNVTGLLAEPCLDDLKEKLDTMVGDVKLREELSRNGREYALSKFSIDAYRDRIVAGYY